MCSSDLWLDAGLPSHVRMDIDDAWDDCCCTGQPPKNHSCYQEFETFGVDATAVADGNLMDWFDRDLESQKKAPCDVHQIDGQQTPCRTLKDSLNDDDEYVMSYKANNTCGVKIKIGFAGSGGWLVGTLNAATDDDLVETVDVVGKKETDGFNLRSATGVGAETCSIEQIGRASCRERV